MRFAAVNTIYEAALKDKNVYFITGDMRHAKTEEFETKLADQYFNAGMAEQNIIGTAAGLALSGMKVFVYSIVPFMVLRCFEQIKVDLCYQNLDVTVIGIGGGFAYGSAGGTHYSIEEIAALRALPNMKIVVPANPTETSILMEELIKEGGPSYMRIGRGKEEDVDKEYPLEFGKARVAKEGKNVSIISAGTIVSEALKAAEILEKDGISVEVINMHTIKPLDRGVVIDRTANKKAIFTLEEHNILGGLGSAVAEVVSETSGDKPIFRRFGVNDAWPKVAGTQDYLRDINGISAEKVAAEIKKLVK